MIKSGPFDILFLNKEGVPIAYTLTSVPPDKVNGEKTIKLDYLYVKPDFRGLNLGRTMIDMVSRNATECGFDRIVGRISPDFGSSKEFLDKLYETAGFEIHGDYLRARLPLIPEERREFCFG